jgi:hypothetical protein
MEARWCLTPYALTYAEVKKLLKIGYHRQRRWLYRRFYGYATAVFENK